MSELSRTVTNRAYAIVGDWFEHEEETILLALSRRWPKEYAQAKIVQKLEDPDFFDPEEGVPNLSVLCEQFTTSSSEEFLKTVKEIIDNLNQSRQ
jgi:hypothetical protein